MGYRGEIKFMFKLPVYKKWERELETPDNIWQIGDRIGQLIIMPYPHIELNEVEELSETDRGEGGFGSTGK